MNNREQSAGHTRTSEGVETGEKGKYPMEELDGSTRGAGGRFHAGSTRVAKKAGGPAQKEGKGEAIGVQGRRDRGSALRGRGNSDGEVREESAPDVDRDEGRREWRENMMNKATRY